METISGGLTISSSNRDKLIEEWKEVTTPEDNFIEDLDTECVADQVVDPVWYGEFSGSTFPYFLDVLTYTYGSIEIIVTWEGGEDVQGIRVVEGVVTQHKVERKLGRKL